MSSTIGWAGTRRPIVPLRADGLLHGGRQAANQALGMAIVGHERHRAGPAAAGQAAAQRAQVGDIVQHVVGTLDGQGQGLARRATFGLQQAGRRPTRPGRWPPGRRRSRWAAPPACPRPRPAPPDAPHRANLRRCGYRSQPGAWGNSRVSRVAGFFLGEMGRDTRSTQNSYLRPRNYRL